MLSKILNKVSSLSLSLSKSSFSSTPTRHSFAKLNESDLFYFASIVQPHEMITDKKDLELYNTDWNKIYKGKSSLLLRPNSTEKISKIMKYCYDKNLAVVPQGGNTGQVGGGVPVFDEIILSMASMKKVHGFNQNNAVLTCEAGCVLGDINSQIAEGYEFPLDVGSKGSCQIGGNIATHARGMHFIKHGPLRANILGLEVVLPDGEVLNLESEVRKDNTGLDIKQMFIGSKGLLGIITKANILCAKKDEFRRVFLIRCKKYEDVLQINRLTKKIAGRNLSALEFFDDFAYNTVLKYIPNVISLETNENREGFYLLVELAGNQPLESLEERYFDALSKAGFADECVLSENEDQALNLWKIRELVAVAANNMGYVLTYNFRVDLNKWMDIMTDVRTKAQSKGGYTLVCGRIGDGSLRVRVVFTDPQKKDNLLDTFEIPTFDWLKKQSGNISAEISKVNHLKYAKQESTIELTRKMKKIFDPKGILNPYKCV